MSLYMRAIVGALFVAVGSSFECLPCRQRPVSMATGSDSCTYHGTGVCAVISPCVVDTGAQVGLAVPATTRCFDAGTSIIEASLIGGLTFVVDPGVPSALSTASTVSAARAAMTRSSVSGENCCSWRL